MKLTTRNPFEEEVTVTVNICTEQDLKDVTRSCCTSTYAAIDGLPIVSDGQVEMYIYNFPREVIRYLHGDTEELEDKLKIT